jgi:thiol-disulfide isomerase/thioredoxin
LNEGIQSLNLKMLSKVYWVFYLIFIAFLACESPSSDFNKLKLSEIAGEKSWQEISKEAVRVYFFLSPECPLCQNYAMAMRDLYQEFGSQAQFVAVFPGEDYPIEDIRKYLIQYKLDFPAFYDPKFKFTKSIGAKITPEAFILNKNDEVVYSGAIDNWAISLGQKRTVITENYLKDALLALEKDQKIANNHEKAVGCYIQ